MSTVNYLTARSSNLATFNTVQLNVSTLTGSTIQTTATATTSSIVVSTLATRSVSYSTMTGSTMTTTSNVGIGTNAPSYLVDMYGSNPTLRIRTSSAAYTSGTATILFDSITTQYPLAQIRAIDMGISPTVYRGDLVFYYQYNTTLTEGLRLTNTGNLGVGTASPGYLLTVGTPAIPAANSAGTTVIQCNGNLNVYRNRLIFSATAADWNHCMYNNYHNIDNEGSWDGMKFNVYNGAWFRVGTAAGAVPTTAMYINASGQVGIGAAYASASFHVHGDGTSYIMAQLNEIKIAGNGNSHWSIFGARSGHGYFSIANTSTNASIGTAGTDVLSITNSNYVGIGTTNPASILTVGNGTASAFTGGSSISLNNAGACYYVGNDGTRQVLFGADASGYGMVGTYSNHDFAIRSNNTERVRITAAGNVGIGITNPSVPLQVNGSIVGSRIYSASGSLTVSTSAVNVYSLSGSQSGFINVYWGNGSALYFFQWIAGVTSVFLNQLTYNASYGSVSISWTGNGPVYITASANITLTLWYVITFNT